MDARRHPCPPKLSMILAEEVRRLRRDGVSVHDLARRYGVAKSSISAVLHLHTYVPDYLVAVCLRPLERGLLAELAADEGIAEEQLASEILSRGLDERASR